MHCRYDLRDYFIYWEARLRRLKSFIVFIFQICVFPFPSCSDVLFRCTVMKIKTIYLFNKVTQLMPKGYSRSNLKVPRVQHWFMTISSILLLPLHRVKTIHYIINLWSILKTKLQTLKFWPKIYFKIKIYDTSRLISCV